MASDRPCLGTAPCRQQKSSGRYLRSRAIVTAAGYSERYVTPRQPVARWRRDQERIGLLLGRAG